MDLAGVLVSWVTGIIIAAVGVSVAFGRYELVVHGHDGRSGAGDG